MTTLVLLKEEKKLLQMGVKESSWEGRYLTCDPMKKKYTRRRNLMTHETSKAKTLIHL